MQGVFVTADYARKRIKSVKDEIQRTDDAVHLGVEQGDASAEAWIAPTSEHDSALKKDKDSLHDMFYEASGFLVVTSLPTVKPLDSFINAVLTFRVKYKGFIDSQIQALAGKDLSPEDLVDYRENKSVFVSIGVKLLFEMNRWKHMFNHNTSQIEHLIILLGDTEDTYAGCKAITDSQTPKPVNTEMKSDYKDIHRYLNVFLSEVAIHYKDLRDYTYEHTLDWFEWVECMDTAARSRPRNSTMVTGARANSYKTTIKRLLEPEKIDICYHRHEIIENMLRSDEKKSKKDTEAWEKNKIYAHKVKGSLINVDIRVVWASTNIFHSAFSDTRLDTIIWNSMKEYVKFNALDLDVYQDEARVVTQLKDSAKRVLRFQRIVTNVLLEQEKYDITKEVEMVEYAVIHRLHGDGVFPWLDQITNDSVIRMEDLLHALRWYSLSYSFAAVVGKKMMTERLIQSGRTNIVEHHRSSAWAEREYLSMYTAISDDAGAMESALKDVLRLKNAP
jgi:hypothetical protein